MVPIGLWEHLLTSIVHGYQKTVTRYTWGPEGHPVAGKECVHEFLDLMQQRLLESRKTCYLLGLSDWGCDSFRTVYNKKLLGDHENQGCALLKAKEHDAVMLVREPVDT